MNVVEFILELIGCILDLLCAIFEGKKNKEEDE
ncbi:hypothetical protein [Bacillus phage CP-51]|uniref:Uncharacterized protein n=1 Tax=Bacillus phage CP-51 TaxID=1391188 RepID=A0A068EQ82_9CAUD|nr:hypothetical protein OZ73_gp057 [Bacillus phage CP-51]AID50492.1 hypothetical protein [Bacillus phage CP-51]